MKKEGKANKERRREETSKDEGTQVEEQMGEETRGEQTRRGKETGEESWTVLLDSDR